MTASNVSQNPPLPETLATTVIEPTRGWASLGLRDIWEYRELLMLLVWREIKGAYRQTALGVSWLFLRPILNVLVLTLVSCVSAGDPSNGAGTSA